ncbi:LOB domain-containing protein 41-like, partial [Trifolium medium]|nr:LOB domain-containing protein 41-like [Trifolium medium]
KTRSRFRRAVKPKPSKKTGSVEDVNPSESSRSQPGKDSESGVSVETSILFHDEPESEAKVCGRADDGVSNEVGLELRLGFEPVDLREPREVHVVPIKKRKFDWKDCNVSCKVELGLEFAA